MSVLQIGDLVSYQLRASYLNEFADGVGERVITLDESIVHSAPFKSAGWRTNPGLVKRTHSPPIPTAVASEYFRAPRSLGLPLDDPQEESEGVLGDGGVGGGAGGGDGGLGMAGGLNQGILSSVAAGGDGRGHGVAGRVMGDNSTVGGSSTVDSALGGRAGRASSEAASAAAVAAATKRRRRREQMEHDEDEDSSDLSDESDDDGSADHQRTVQQIKFAKMPTRFRSGSSPLQSSNLRQPPMEPPASPPLHSSQATAAATAAVAAAAAAAAAVTAGGATAGGAGGRASSNLRRGSQSAVESVKERARRDTVTSSEMSSENEFDASGFHRLREQERKDAIAAAVGARIGAGSGGRRDGRRVGGNHKSGGRDAREEERSGGRRPKTAGRGRMHSDSAGSSTSSNKPQLQRQDSELLEEEREDEEDDDEDDDEDDEDDEEASDDASDDDESEEGDDGSDMSSTFAGSMDSALILHEDGDNPLNGPAAGQDPIIGTPPREFTRTATVRRSQHPAILQPVGELPPRRPLSTIRPLSMVAPRSLLTAALQAKKAAAAMPFERFASFSGKGDPHPISVRIYAPASSEPTEPFEVPIRPTVHQEQGPGERPVTVADLIGLSLWRYAEEKREPAIPAGRLNVNWWTLRMVEEGGEVDDDFPPLERTRQLTSFTTANNGSGGGGGGGGGGDGKPAGRFRANSKVYDDFALVEASASAFADNQRVTPQYEEEKPQEEAETATETANEKEHSLNLNSLNSLNAGGDDDDDGDRTPRNATPQPGALSRASTVRTGTTGLSAVRTLGGVFSPLDQPRLNPIITTTYRYNAAHVDAPAVPATTANTMRGRKKLLRVHIHSPDAAPGQMVTVEVTTDMYLEQVLDMVCKKRQLDKGSHVLKLPSSGVVVLTDRAVSSLGNVADLELYRKRFVGEGTAIGMGMGMGMGMGSLGSPLVGGGGSASPKMLTAGGSSGGGGGGGASSRRVAAAAAIGLGLSGSVGHPLAREITDASYQQYTVWRRQGLKLMGSSERVLTIDGEYVHIGGASTGKVTTVHFSNVVGCKVSLRHPTHFKLIVYKATESKRYDFVAKSAAEAHEIVACLKKAMSPYRDI